MRIVQQARCYRLDWRYFRKASKLMSDDGMPRWWLAEPARRFSVRMSCIIVYLPCWFRLYHPASQWLSAMTQKRASLDCMIEFTGPNGHKNVRLKSNYPSLRCQPRRISANKVTLFGAMGVMERNGHLARGIETWGKFDLGVWKRSNKRNWSFESIASESTEERVQRLEKRT